jgi:hypothetical protein
MRLMRTIVATALVVSTAIVPVVASAAEVEGKIQSLDQTERTIVLDNGTKITVGADVSMDNLKQGSDVKVSYDERDGKNVATKVEVK